MPIRHCQKCGLKVLIDESQAGANPFYCQRCTTAMKSSDQPEPAGPAVSGLTPVKREVPSAIMSASSPTTPQPAAGPSRATVKVLCPYCKASFNGRVPQKPARGACPVCQKELILLPNGGIRAAAGFDIAKWQQEIKEGVEPAAALEPEPVAVGGPATPPPAPPKESGTRLLIKKYSAEQAGEKADTGTRILSRKQAEPTPLPPTAPPEIRAELPDWLDDKKPSKPTTDELIREKEYERDPAATETPEIPEDDGTALAAPAVEEPLPEPVASKFAGRPAAVVRQPPPPPPPAASAKPATVIKKPGTVRKMTERRSAAAAAAEPAGAATGGGKVFVAYLILLIPLAACPVLLNAREKLKGTVVEKLGGMFQRGFHALYEKLTIIPVAPKPKPVEEKKAEAPAEPVKPSAEERQADEDKLIKLHQKIMRLTLRLKNDTVGKTPEELAAFEPARAELKKDEEEYDRLDKQYEKIYGAKYKRPE